MQAEVFISYSRTDKAFVERLHGALEALQRPSWVDWEGIPPTAEWMAEIHSAIEAAQTVVFVISPASISSKVCGQELEHAVVQRKRLVPIVCAEVDADSVHSALRKLNWIYAREYDVFDESIEKLLGAMDSDLERER